MKKNWIALVLAGAMSVSLLAGCKDKGEGSSSETPETNVVEKVKYEDGTHIFTAPERANEYLVQDGATEYKILLPSLAGLIKQPYAKKAADELVLFFKQATGITLDCHFEDEGTASKLEAGQKYISIGHTELFADKEIEVDAVLLRSSGYRIVTKDDHIFLFGYGDVANAYAVYGFLDILFNYEYFATDCWTIDEGVTEVKMRDFNVTDVPDSPYRDCYWDYVSADTENNTALRFREEDVSFNMPVGDKHYVDTNGVVQEGIRRGYHNTNEIIPTTAATTQAEWLSINGDQLCYTARGDDVKYDGLTSQIASVLEQSLVEYPVAEYPDYKLFTLTIEDTGGLCTCESCLEASALYGAPVGAAMVLCNDVMEKVDAWMELPENEAYKREDFFLMFFAYGGFVQAPAHYDETKKEYVVNHPDLELRDDVGVFYAASNINYKVSIYDESNDAARENALAWFDISPAMYYWLYQVNFTFYPAMLDTFDHFDSEGYQFYMSGSPMAVLNQAAFNQTNVTAFDGLKIYLESKLLWDCTLDSDKLIDDWFEAMFGKAADAMRKLYREEKAHMNALYDQLGVRDVADIVGHNIGKMEYFPVAVLSRWLDIIDEAHEINRAAYATSDPETYERNKRHIDCEMVSPAYILLNFYDQEQLGEQFVTVAQYLKANYEHLKGYRQGQSSSGDLLEELFTRIKIA